MNVELFDLKGVSLWTGVDVGVVPPTPKTAPGPLLKDDITSEHAIFDLAMELGLYIKPYAEEKRGAMIHNVVPVQGKEASLSNEGSAKFPMHVEVPQDENRPDYLVLLCLRGNHGAYTNYALVADILELMQERYKPLMYKAIFDLRVGDSWKNAGEILRVAMIDDTGCRMNLGNMKPRCSAGEELIEEINRIMPLVIRRICLRTGDMMLINNRFVVHGREAFPCTYDGRQRWIQRAYLKYP